MKLTHFCAIALVIAFVVPGYAKDAAVAAKDAQSAYEPVNKPGVGHEFLKRLVGEWSVKKTFYPKGGSAVVSSGTCHQSMIHDGRFLKCEFVFEQNGTETTGLGVIGYDVDSEQFTSFWTDSRSTRMSVRQSEGNFDGATLVMHSRQISPSGDANHRPKRNSLTETQIEDDGNRIVHQQYSVGDDQQKLLIMKLVMKRTISPGTDRAH
jgi:hypothetical protein